MRVWAVIPVKSPYRSKQRLARVLSLEERAQLVRRLLRRLIAALQELPQIEQIVIVTGDAEVAELAANAGAVVLAETTPPDLNAAVTQGVQYAAQQGADGVIILPTDLPLVSANAVASVLNAAAPDTYAGGNGAVRPHVDAQPLLVICPDEVEEGTNAIFMTPINSYTFHYGPGSFRQHVTEAARRGYAVCVVTIPALAFDLDTEDDWLSYQLIKA